MLRKWSKISSKLFRRARFDNRKAPLSEWGFFITKRPKSVFTLADDQTFALGGLAGQLANTTHALRFFAGTPFRRLFIVISQLHLTKDTFTLKFFLQNLIGLINVIITNGNLHVSSPFQNKF